MQIVTKTLLVATLAAASTVALAARPSSLVYTGSGTTDGGVEFSNYSVKCTDGQRHPLTAWDNRRKWCLGDGSQEECHRKQIKAAKQACRAG